MPIQFVHVDQIPQEIHVVSNDGHSVFDFFITATRDGFSYGNGGVSEWINISYQKRIGGIVAPGPAYIDFDGHTANGHSLGIDQATAQNTLTPWVLASDLTVRPYPKLAIFTSTADNWSTDFRINYFRALPEPESWLLLVIGFAAIGAAVRQRHALHT